MSRRLTGSITYNQNRGTFTASLASGIPGKRRAATFESRREAESWLEEGLRLRKRGQVVPPHRRPGQRPTDDRGSGTPFLAVADQHIRERYVEDRHGDIDRESQVRGYAQAIDEYLRHRGLSLETVTRQDIRAMWQHMLKDGAVDEVSGIPESLDLERLVTRKEALVLLAAHGFPISESTFKRAVVARKLRPVDITQSAHRFRIADVLSSRAGLAKSADATASPPHRARFAHSTLLDVRRTFRAVVEHAEAEGVAIHGGVLDAEIPHDKTSKSRTRALTRQEAARIATRLHVVHQLVLWLLVLLGLRVSEVYGILVEDVIDNGPGMPGLVMIQSQGGRKFRTRQADGSTAVTAHLDRTKGNRSDRILVVPSALMDVIRAVVEVFHTDEHGVARTKARLVPGLAQQDEGGQSSFRNALTRAGAAEAINITFQARSRGGGVSQTVTPTPQKLRQSYATTHRADLVAIEDIRTTLGQGLGESVLHTNYLIDDLGLSASRRIANETQQQIEAELSGSLFIPTAVRCTTERQHALSGRAPEIDAKLIEKNWLTSGTPAGDWMTVADAAACFGVTQHQVRDDIRAGKLAAINEQRPDQAGHRYLISADEISGYADMIGAASDLVALADELELSYDTVRQFVSRHPVLELRREPGQRNGSLSVEDAELVRGYFQNQVALGLRAVRLTDVARDLGISVAAVDTLIKRGELDEDDRFHGGQRSLTRASLDRFRQGRRRGRRRV